MPLVLPDLTAYSFGGVTLFVALYIVLQSLKRSRPRIAANMPEIVLAASAVLVGTLMWAPPAFVFLAGTIITAALVIGGHATMKSMGGPKDPTRPT